MAARAILGVLIGILFAPVIYLILMSIGTHNTFADWFWMMMSDFNGFISTWMSSGVESTLAPLITTATHPGSLLAAFTPGYSLLSGWIPIYAPALITWTVIGAWSGAIERSAGRGIGVGVGCWLGWLIIAIIGTFLIPIISYDILDLLYAMLMTVIVVIVVASIFGTMTKSEEF